MCGCQTHLGDHDDALLAHLNPAIGKASCGNPEREEEADACEREVELNRAA